MATRAMSTGVDQHPPPAALVTGSGRRDLAAEAGHRRHVDRAEPERQGPGDVAQLKPRQRRGEQHVDVTAAGRRDVGEDLAAAAGHEPGESLGLGADLGRVTFMMLPSSTIMNVTAGAGGIKVEGQHPAGTRAGIKDRDRARLARRIGGKRPRVRAG